MNFVQKNLLKLADAAVFVPQFIGQSIGMLPPNDSHLSIDETESGTRIRFEEWPEQRWPEVEVVLPGSYSVYGVYAFALKRILVMITPRSREDLARDFAAVDSVLPKDGRIELGPRTELEVRSYEKGCIVSATQTRTFDDLESSAIERFKSLVEPS
jgi:hypothetical protein